MNKDNLLKLELKLRRMRHEEHYNQQSWMRKTGCGTAACLAGHAVTMMGAKPIFTLGGWGGPDTVAMTCKLKDRDVVVSIEEEARAILGLTEEEAGVLFTDSPEAKWPTEYATRWSEATDHNGNQRPGAEKPSRIAADLLKAVREGKVELGVEDEGECDCDYCR